CFAFGPDHPGPEPGAAGFAPGTGPARPGRGEPGGRGPRDGGARDRPGAVAGAGPRQAVRAADRTASGDRGRPFPRERPDDGRRMRGRRDPAAPRNRRRRTGRGSAGRGRRHGDAPAAAAGRAARTGAADAPRRAGAERPHAVRPGVARMRRAASGRRGLWHRGDRDEALLFGADGQERAVRPDDPLRSEQPGARRGLCPARRRDLVF
ncbi:conserved hypothetical protein, partial [Ricinus communis]